MKMELDTDDIHEAAHIRLGDAELRDRVTVDGKWMWCERCGVGFYGHHAMRLCGICYDAARKAVGHG